MELSVFGGQCNTMMNKRCEREGMSQPKVLLGVWRWKSRTRGVRNRVIDVKWNSVTRMGFRSIKPKETITRERH